MSGLQLRLRRTPVCPVDASPLDALSTCRRPDEASRLELRLDGETLPLADLFDISATSFDGIVVEGDLRQFSHLASRWGPRELRVEGDIGNFLCGPTPGRRSGMRAGRVIIRGDAGHHAGHRMRRGTLILLGNAGHSLGSDLVAGTIAIQGRYGDHLAAGMRRGTIITLQRPRLSPTRFTTARKVSLGVATLIANDLHRDSPVHAEMLRGCFDRQLGDRSAGGLGEIWMSIE